MTDTRQNLVTLEKLKSLSVIAGTRSLLVSDVMASAGLVNASIRLKTAEDSREIEILHRRHNRSLLDEKGAVPGHPVRVRSVGLTVRMYQKFVTRMACSACLIISCSVGRTILSLRGRGIERRDWIIRAPSP